MSKIRDNYLGTGRDFKRGRKEPWREVFLFLVPGNTGVNKIEISLFLSCLYDSGSTFSFIYYVFCSVYKYFQY